MKVRLNDLIANARENGYVWLDPSVRQWERTYDAYTYDDAPWYEPILVFSAIAWFLGVSLVGCFTTAQLVLNRF